MRGRAALVTGASSGIGRAIALALAAAGCQLLLSGRREAALAETAAGCAGRATLCPGDLGEAAVVDRLAETARARFGRLDILVHVAAIHLEGAVAATPAEKLAELFAIDVTAPYALTRAMLPLLRAGGAGDIVFVNSSQGLRTTARLAGYGAAKHALKGMADGLREELNPLGLRVLSVYCGKTATSMQRGIYEARGLDYAAAAERMLQPEDVAAAVTALLALPRNAEATDLSIRPAQPG